MSSHRIVQSQDNKAARTQRMRLDARCVCLEATFQQAFEGGDLGGGLGDGTLSSIPSREEGRMGGLLGTARAAERAARCETEKQRRWASKAGGARPEALLQASPPRGQEGGEGAHREGRPGDDVLGTEDDDRRRAQGPAQGLQAQGQDGFHHHPAQALRTCCRSRRSCPRCLARAAMTSPTATRRRRPRHPST